MCEPWIPSKKHKVSKVAKGMTADNDGRVAVIKVYCKLILNVGMKPPCTINIQ
jgi:hypothetical protein